MELEEEEAIVIFALEWMRFVCSLNDPHKPAVGIPPEPFLRDKNSLCFGEELDWSHGHMGPCRRCRGHNCHGAENLWRRYPKLESATQQKGWSSSLLLMGFRKYQRLWQGFNGLKGCSSRCPTNKQKTFSSGTFSGDERFENTSGLKIIKRKKLLESETSGNRAGGPVQLNSEQTSVET